MFIKVCAVIVTFNPDVRSIEKLINSLTEQNCYVVVVDNYSEDTTFCSSLNCEVILLGDNRGIGYAQNIGICRSLELSASHTILFDQDSQIPPTLISVLQREIDTLPNCVALGPCFVNADDGLLYPQIKLNKWKPEPIFLLPENTTADVMYLIASGCMIKNSMFESIGKMNEDFFIDLVDVEWCLRATSLGYEVKATNKVCIEHYIGSVRKKAFGKIFSIHSSFRRYYMVRNSILLSRMEHCPKGYRFYLVSISLMKNILHSTLFGDGFSHLKMSLKGLYAGFKGITGKLQ